MTFILMILVFIFMVLLLLIWYVCIDIYDKFFFNENNAWVV